MPLVTREGLVAVMAAAELGLPQRTVWIVEVCFPSSSPSPISFLTMLSPFWTGVMGTVPRGPLKPGDTKTALNLLLCLQHYSVLISNSGISRVA